MFVSCPAARFHATSRTMCIYVYPCVCLHVRDMYAICARYACGSAGTSLFHSQGSAALSVFHALHACGSAGTFTLPLSRQRGGTWACLYVGGDGLPDCSAFEFVGVRVRVGRSLSGGPCLRSCGPAALRVCFVLSCCQRCMRHDLAPPMSAAVPAAALAAATREVALEAWRWRLGAGGLALEASWPVAVRRRALGAFLLAVPPVLVALGVARRGAWRGECRLWVPRAYKEAPD